MKTFKKGDIVLYSPIMMHGEPSFGGVVREEPWQLGRGEWVTHVTGLGQAYREFTHQPERGTAYVACFDALELAPTVLCSDGVWRSDSDAGVSLADPGLRGAIYWHDGNSSFSEAGWRYSLNGDDGWTHGMHTASYEAARAAVEEACR